MKKFYLTLLISSFAFAGVPVEIQNSLSAFKPISVEKNSQILTITANENRVTETIYNTIINNGVCMPIWLGKLDALNGINEIIVINKYQKQGYVFKGGKSACDKLGEASQKNNSLVLMGYSSMY